MPELPEVEVCRLGVLPGVQGRRIRQAVARTARLRHDLLPELGELLAGRLVVDVLRRGKYLLFLCRGEEDDGWLIVHLGMTGNLRFVPVDAAPQKHDHFDLVFDNTILRYGDPRRFGMISWQAGSRWEDNPGLAGLGVEPLSEAFSADWLFEVSRRRSGPIKPLLMDAHLVVGVGNIYASESLFRAAISPLRAANRISRKRYGVLVSAIRQTLEEAIAAGGSSIRDYLHSDGSSGYFQLSCAVYGRAGQPCRRCGSVLRQVRQGGRSTFYCGACQR